MSQIPNFIDIRPVRAELFHLEGRTDITKLVVAFRSFANTSKYVSIFILWAEFWKSDLSYARNYIKRIAGWAMD
jgi:hypothetical protein